MFTVEAKSAGIDTKRNQNPIASCEKAATEFFGRESVRVHGHDTVVASNFPSPLSVVGTVIRYGFYAVGTLVLGLIGLGIMALWSIPPKPIDAPPAFRVAASSLARLPVSGHVLSSSRIGRAEVRQYGRLSNRDIDLAVVMVMPPKGIGMGTELMQDLRNVNLLKLTRAVLTQTHYDMETRFGEFRATEMRVDSDGRWKQCLAFRSRLDTASVYLTGWYCDATGSKPSANALACTLDKLVIERELASKEADVFLRDRMAKAAYCSAEQVTQTTDTGSRRVSPPQRWSQPTAQRSRY